MPIAISPDSARDTADHRDRGRDRHERARVHLFRFVLRVRLNRPSAMRSVSISQHHESQLRGLRHGFGPTVCIELG
jgi:hypothetical protein